MAVNKTQPKPVAGYKQHYHVFYFWVCLCVWSSTVHTLLFSGVEYKAEYKLWSRFVDLRKHVCVCVEEHNINGSRQSQVCNPFVLAASRRSHPQRQTLWWSERAPVRSCVCPGFVCAWMILMEALHTLACVCTCWCVSLVCRCDHMADSLADFTGRRRLHCSACTWNELSACEQLRVRGEEENGKRSSLWAHLWVSLLFRCIV